jgi:hypothetical protein
MVLLDADVIVTRPLTPLLEDASRGEVVAFENDWDRFFPEWSAFGLGQPSTRRYVNCGHLIFSIETASELLPTFVELQQRLDPATTHFGGADMSSPFYFADQDVLNAILCTTLDGRVQRIEHRLAPFPPFWGLKVRDAASLICTYKDGVAPYLLHHILGKPWLTPTKGSPYTVLFTRLVTANDVPIRLRADELPLRLRDSPFAPVDRMRASVQAEMRYQLLKMRARTWPALKSRMNIGQSG